MRNPVGLGEVLSGRIGGFADVFVCGLRVGSVDRVDIAIARAGVCKRRVVSDWSDGGMSGAKRCERIRSLDVSH